MAYLGVSPSNGVRKVHTYTATASQTTFSGAGAENISLSYRDSTYIDVYQNGVKLGDADYTATSGTSVVLGTGASADDIVVVVVYDVFSVADTVSKTDGGQFDGAVTFAGAFTSLGIDDNADANAITIDSSERVGIGNTTPDGGKLHVTNSTGAIGYFQSTQSASNVENIILNATQTNSSANLSFQIENGTTAKGQFRLNGDNSLEFRNGTTLTERMRIDSNGHVGIGNTASGFNSQAQNLVVGSGSGDSGITIYSGSGSGDSGNIFFADGTGDSDETRGGITYNHETNALNLRVNDSPRMYIDSSGNVGINESSPLGKLHVRTSDASLTTVNANADDLIIENNGNCGMSICSSTSGEGNLNFIDSGDTNVGRIQYSHTDNTMSFRANDNVGMTLDSNGRIQITSDGQASFTSDASLEVRGQQNPLVFFNQTQNADVVNLRMRHDFARSGQTCTMIQFRNNGNSEVGTIKVSNTGTSYNTSSDYRLKESVNYDFDATTRFKQLKPCRFNFITDKDQTVDGFLAHEVSSIVPEAISGEKDATNEDGSIKPQGIDQSKLVPLLTKTLQEALTRIDTLEAEVKTLKGE
jgi:hypothetical protein